MVKLDVVLELRNQLMSTESHLKVTMSEQNRALDVGADL